MGTSEKLRPSVHTNDGAVPLTLMRLADAAAVIVVIMMVVAEIRASTAAAAASCFAIYMQFSKKFCWQWGVPQNRDDQLVKFSRYWTPGTTWPQAFFMAIFSLEPLSPAGWNERERERFVAISDSILVPI